MTLLYFTIDTEYEVGFTARRGAGSRAENFARSIRCTTPDGEVGIFHQMDRFDEHGLKGVFFVDPMPALLWGVEAIADVVGPIVERGHDVQLHLHTEWLALAGSANPLRSKTGTNIKDFTLDEQMILLEWARDTLMAAGAPRPIAFRAGNYGANDDTLCALAQLGLTHDSSHCPGFMDSAAEISLTQDDRHPMPHKGVIEVPAGCVGDMISGLRHAQLTALSMRELRAALRHARDNDFANFTVVSHSFELLSRDRKRANRILTKRFEQFCAALEKIRNVTTATYRDNPPQPVLREDPRPVLPAAPVLNSLRIVEQAVVNTLYS